MTQPDAWQDTEQLDPNAAASDAPTPAADETPGAAFPDTEMHPHSESGDQLWPEAVDGRCGENASEFAASQPAPLSIV